MNLFASALVTIGIVALIWGLVMLQPAIAKAPTPLTTTAAAATDLSKPLAEPIIATEFLAGLTRTIGLDSVSLLWAQFEESFDEYQLGLTNPDRVMVLYRDLNGDYSQAKVTIGFPTATPQDAAAELPPLAQGEPLLAQGQHGEAELLAGWHKLDAARSVDQVLEIHYLSPLGLTESSQLLVFYK